MTKFLALLILSAATLPGCFLTPGLPDDSELLDGPIASLTGSQLDVFLRGDEAFGRRFSFAEGLGPVFNGGSCAACHPADGRGHPEFGFFRFGRSGADGFDPMVEHGGPQLQDRAAPGATPESIPAAATGHTFLLAPPVTGLGLLEAVDDDDILALADPMDDDNDGISGRVHWRRADDDLRRIAAEIDGVGRRAVEHADGFIGRFGRRGSNISLLHQAVSAYHQDMGITSDFAPRDLSSGAGVGATDGAVDPELGSGELSDVVFYLRTLRPPARRGADDSSVRSGEQVFADIGCANCHIPTLRTGRSSVAALDRVEFHPYTDLLLHSMGDELADGYAENGSAIGEWRTPPLWGLGLASEFTAGEVFLMHDGRARSITEAIELHGGEANASRLDWLDLAEADRADLLKFLESL